MATVHIHEAKTHFSKLIQRALAGEEIIVAKGKTPLIKLTPLPGATAKRELGTQKDFIKSISPDFDEPLEEFDPYFQ
jgi:antitoxin (DNA-binding transcriptional repressor) of toxin-antitoxin stability system